MSNKLLLFLAIGFLLCSNALLAQTKSVSGTVTDGTDGTPIPGANILVKGSTTGTSTDFDGKFTIDAADDAILVISYIGYKTQEVPVAGKTTLTIKLATDTENLKEVVVTALGIKRETKALGYSVSEVNSEDLNQGANNQVASALNGKAAGVQISTSGSGMGGSTKITIRGNKSLSGKTEPLWVVDGVPFNDNQVGDDAGEYGGIDRAGASYDLNPDDIESISVLKGASASALYGSRASNGVILVTTKSGSRNKNKLGVTYSTSVVFSDVAYLLDLQRIYGQGSGGNYANNVGTAWGPKMEGQMLESWTGETIPYEAQADQRKAFFETGLTQAHNISVSGGGDKTTARASFGYNKTDDVTPNSDLYKYNYDLRLSHKLSDKLSLDSKLSYIYTNGVNRPESGQYGYMPYFNSMPANIRTEDLTPGYIYDEGTGKHNEVNYNGTPNANYRNPYYLNASRKNEDERYRTFGFVSALYQITDDLSIKGKYGLDSYREKIETKNLYLDTAYPNNAPNYTKSENFFKESNLEFLLTYKKDLTEDLDFNVTLGANRMQRTIEGLSASSGKIDGEGKYYLGLGANVTASNTYTEKEIQSVYGLMSFGFKDYLFLDLTARNDWSSTLPSNNRSYFYPSVSLSYVLSDAFNLQSNTISLLKLRGSWAEVGKDTDPYQLVPTYSVGSNNFGNIYASEPTLLLDPDLKPEITKSYEFGIDAKFFQNRLGLDFSYYHTNTHNQVLNVDIPQSTQYTQKTINAGNIQNSGIEALLYVEPIKTEDFTLGLDFNFSTNNTKIIDLAEGVDYYEFGSLNNGIAVRGYTGGKLGDIYGKTYLRDDNGNIVLDDNGLPSINGDQTKLGNIQPDFLGSIKLSVDYKQMYMTALFNMQQGGDIYSFTEAQAVSAGTAARTVNREAIAATGVDAQQYYQRIAGAAEEFVYDASYMKLGEFSIGYRFSNDFLEKFTHNTIQSAKFGVVGRNLFYLYKHTPGTTPDAGSYNRTLFGQAIDYATIPNTRSIGLSLNVSF
ncbi:SusC/RagA family TonB-linked outer membrane protein [Zhouia sp. PK063]|uniref:SusC/RagA family TonB-linked outer membrane protein n=1 Tax=Zhouia sp. PK063 TaxID=3373602 RepID=UPI003799F3CF